MKLEKICEIKTGVPISRYLNEKGNFQIKYLNLKSVNNFSITQNSLTDGKTEKEISYQYFAREGDILIKLAEPNDVVLIDKNNTGLVITQYFGIIRVTSDKVDPSYLAHILNSKKTKQKYKRKIEGSGLFSILKLSILRELEVELPSLEKQIKLRNFWNLLEKKSKLIERKKELFDEYKREIIGG